MSDSAQPIAALDRRSLQIALLVPAAVVMFDVLVGKYTTNLWNRHWLLLLVVITIVEVAVVAWFVGRYVRLPWLKWGIFVWTIALVDLGVYSGFSERSVGGVPLIFAQGVMLLAWMTLSDTAWVWRLPVTIIAITVILPMAVWSLDQSLDYWDGNPWMPLLVIGFFAQGIVFLLLRLRGFQLRNTVISDRVAKPDSGRDVSQFGIKHLLIWTSVLAPLLTMVRLVEWRSSWWIKSFGHLGNELTIGLSLGFLLALGGMVVFWAVLGAGNSWFRVTVAVTAVAGISGVLVMWANYLDKQARAGILAWPTFDSITYTVLRFQGNGLWLSWVMFAFGLLAALLLFLRASGQRLVRIDVSHPMEKRTE